MRLPESTCKKQLPAAACVCGIWTEGGERKLQLKSYRPQPPVGFLQMFLQCAHFLVSVPTFAEERNWTPFWGSALFHVGEEVGVNLSESIWPTYDPLLSTTPSLILGKGSRVPPRWPAWDLLNRPGGHFLWFGEKHRFTQLRVSWWQTHSVPEHLNLKPSVSGEAAGQLAQHLSQLETLNPACTRGSMQRAVLRVTWLFGI